MIPVSALDDYTRDVVGLRCVKPTGFDIDPVTHWMPMCGQPATHVAVRDSDSWISGTIWCAEHVEKDTAKFDLFTWQPLDMSA